MKRRSLLLLFSVVFMDMVGFGFIIPLLPDYITRFGGTPALVGLLTSAYALGQFFAAPIVGRLSDRYGRKPLLIFSIGGTFLSLLLLGAAWALPVLFVSRILDGLTGGNITVAQSYISDVTSEKERAKGLGMIGAAFGLGFILGPLFGGLLSRFGLAVPAFAAAGMAFLNLLLITFVLPESLTAEKREEMKLNPGRKFSVKLLTDALKTRKMGALLYVIAFYSLAFIMFQTMFSLVAKERLGVDAQVRGYLLAYVGVLVATVQGGLIGILTKRYSEPRLMAASSILLVIGFILWAVAPTVWFLMIALLPLALGGGVLSTVNRSMLSKSVEPEKIGGALGLSTAMESMNGIIAPALGGLLVTSVGNWAPGAAAALIMVLVTIFVLRRVVKPRLFAGFSVDSSPQGPAP